MKNVMEYIKLHAKKFIIGAVAFVATLGIYGLYKLYQMKKGS